MLNNDKMNNFDRAQVDFQKLVECYNNMFHYCFEDGVIPKSMLDKLRKRMHSELSAFYDMVHDFKHETVTQNPKRDAAFMYVYAYQFVINAEVLTKDIEWFVIEGKQDDGKFDQLKHLSMTENQKSRRMFADILRKAAGLRVDHQILGTINESVGKIVSLVPSSVRNWSRRGYSDVSLILRDTFHCGAVLATAAVLARSGICESLFFYLLKGVDAHV